MTFNPIPGTTIIGFGHKARHGKDTCCQAIHETYPAITKIYSLAGALKAYCRVAHNMTQKDGSLLQLVGTDLFRSRDPEAWIRPLYWQIAEERPPFALIADTRFPNEVDFIKSLGGYCVKVTRLNADGTLFVATDRNPLHLSETALDSYDGWDDQVWAESGDVVGLARKAIRSFVEFWDLRETQRNQEAVA